MVNKKYQTPRVRVVDFAFSHMIAVSPVDGGKTPVVTDPEEEKDAADAMVKTEFQAWNAPW